MIRFLRSPIQLNGCKKDLRQNHLWKLWILTLLRIVYFISEHGITYVMLSAIWYHEKREKNPCRSVTFKESFFYRSVTLWKWYQIAQSISYLFLLLECFFVSKPFLTSVPILYPLKTFLVLTFSTSRCSPISDWAGCTCWCIWFKWNRMFGVDGWKNATNCNRGCRAISFTR